MFAHLLSRRQGLMGPDHDGSDQLVVIICCSGFATFSPHAARASSSGDPDRALFLVHKDAGRENVNGTWAACVSLKVRLCTYQEEPIYA
ncbi:uncharacterized protein PgNI_04032 [Pyricularia grisea]|uniref:Uncharacterized protein n=1 Tax=Pyricularia grisea TaxID=148305 RepID=A0A6P8BFA0_PYRGI|nr:uncharacterized protein PgNI_04032 [Pyricularia grisea]TLD14399.1 hypothetical protein PgNI_04032 [Pyricularia grisea]